MHELPDVYELPDVSGLSVAEKNALILALFEQVKRVERLIAMVQALSARVRELEGRLRRDSHNSSKSPYSDRLARKPKSLRQSSGRKPGRRAGHEGTTLERVATPDVIVQHPLPEHCAMRPMARDRGCPRVLHRPIRAAGALRNERCGKLCNPRARQVKRGARRLALKRYREPGGR